MRLLLVVLALLPVGCASTKSLGPGATVEDQLGAVSRESGTFGDLVYVGTVATLKEPTRPVYEYERRVKDGSSTSFTKQGAEPVLIEQATHDPEYGLSSYVQWQLQTREVGRVTVSQFDFAVASHIRRGTGPQSSQEPPLVSRWRTASFG